MANLLAMLGKKSSLQIMDLKESTQKQNVWIATLADGRKAFIHNDAVTADGWTGDAKTGLNHPDLKSFMARRQDKDGQPKNDLWLTFELPTRNARLASDELI